MSSSAVNFKVQLTDRGMSSSKKTIFGPSQNNKNGGAGSDQKQIESRNLSSKKPDQTNITKSGYRTMKNFFSPGGKNQPKVL